MRRGHILCVVAWAACLMLLAACTARQQHSGLPEDLIVQLPQAPASPSVTRGTTGSLSSSAEELQKKPTGVLVAIAVVGSEGELLLAPREVCLYPGGKWEITPLGALEASGLAFKLSPRYPEFVEEIAGQRNRGQAGWMYSVNGEIPMVSAARKRLKAGDRVIWWYSRNLGQVPPSWEGLLKKVKG